MNAGAAPSPARWKPLLRVAGSVLLLLVLILVFPRHKLLQALRSIPLSTLAAVIPVYLAVHALGALKWQWIVNRAGAAIPVRESVRCYFAGLFSNIFIPTVVGGDVVMVAMGVSRTKRPEAIVSGTFSSRVLDLLALLVLACVAMFVLPHGPNPEAERLIDLILAVFLCGGVAAVLLALLLRRKIAARVDKYWRAFAIVWSRPAFAGAVFGLTLFLQTALIGLTWWLGVGCGLDLPLRAWLLAWPLAKLSALVPLTVAGIGTREFVLAALLARFGAEPAAAASVGLAWDAVFISGNLLAGMISKSAGWLAPLPPESSPAPGEPCTT